MRKDLDEIKKAELGAKTLEEFLKQFGSDLHAEVVLECLFQELLDEKTISLLGESQQKGD
jgi:hypothetical protein